jgi:hypothetical protein
MAHRPVGKALLRNLDWMLAVVVANFMPLAHDSDDRR